MLWCEDRGPKKNGMFYNLYAFNLLKEMHGSQILAKFRYTYLPTLQIFLGVSKFFIKSPGLILVNYSYIVLNDILTMQRFLDISRFLYSGDWQVWIQQSGQQIE